MELESSVAGYTVLRVSLCFSYLKKKWHHLSDRILERNCLMPVTMSHRIPQASCQGKEMIWGQEDRASSLNLFSICMSLPNLRLSLVTHSPHLSSVSLLSQPSIHSSLLQSESSYRFQQDSLQGLCGGCHMERNILKRRWRLTVP